MPSNVTVFGNLARDPETRVTSSGKTITDITIASNEGKDVVHFLQVQFWEKPAELINQHFKKGNPIFVTGSLATDSWEDKTTGQKRSKTFVKGREFSFVGGGKPAEGKGAEKPSSETGDDSEPAF